MNSVGTCVRDSDLDAAQMVSVPPRPALGTWNPFAAAVPVEALGTGSSKFMVSLFAHIQTGLPESDKKGLCIRLNRRINWEDQIWPTPGYSFEDLHDQGKDNPKTARISQQNVKPQNLTSGRSRKPH